MVNREIKFRVWDIHLKKYIKWESMLCHSFQSKDYVYQQYTGLKDKNDVEVYEDDIVEWKNNFSGKIVWSEEDVAFIFKSNTGGAAFLTEIYIDNFCVIGNIFENKDLFENL